MKAIAPGKLILSGEHAVVHGKPALVMAVDKQAHAAVQTLEEEIIRVAFPDMLGTHELPTADLPSLRLRLHENYDRFLKGAMGIRHVLDTPVELIHYAVAHFLEKTGRSLQGGLDIRLTTDLPVGCGMGSSAAVVASVFGGLAALFGIAPSRDRLYRWTLDVEKLQHGRPSGVDPFITVHGGLVRFQRGETHVLAPPQTPLLLALTGVPESTTGECVAQVSQAHPKNDPVWSEFERVTDELTRAFRQGQESDVSDAVRANHRLLVGIGVVPDKVRRCIESVEAAGGAAKVCGAGAVSGDAGGIVWIVGGPSAEAACKEHGYDTFPVHADTRGLTF